MVLKGKISFDKKNLPPYIFFYNVALITFLIAWLALCLPLMAVIGIIYGEAIITYITMIVSFSIFAVGMLIFVVLASRLRKRLVDEKCAEIEKEFEDMPLEQATQILKDKGVINESGFILKEDIFGNKVVPFDRMQFLFYAYASLSEICYCIALAEKDDNKLQAIYSLDGALYNFLNKYGFDINYKEWDKKAFSWIAKEKRLLCKVILGYRI